MLLTSTTSSTEALTSEVEEQVNKMTDIGSWFQNLGTGALTMLIKIAFCIFLYWLIRKILLKVLDLLDRTLDKRGVSPTVRHFTTALIRVCVLGFIIVTMVVQLNIVAASSIAALIAAAGVGVSLAVQGVLSNFAGGVLILLLKPFKEGDYISVRGENVEGTVRKIELYYTTIYTPDRCILVIPNSTLTGKSVVNAISDGLKRLVIEVGVSYSTDVHKAMAVLDRLMDEEPRIRKENRRTYVSEMGESSVTVGLRCLCKVEDYLDLQYDMTERIRIAFDEEKIDIPFNQLDVHLVGGAE